ncbi:hypothetical protein O181_112878 [Austropuccinia psidii MF-1]|uniref:Uncharacterized protein n=1 Tax=Austropuccinia psidii MF-1 TaxID=1389203 RepID=A0A9Q3K200_9BASI|nr:hypothetical protein [Austropuccinia psidii MF-1]
MQTAFEEVLTDISPLFSYFDLVEENYISLETQSQANTPVTPSEPVGRKSKGKRHKKITIVNPVVTSKGKLPKSADDKFVQGTVKETLASKGTSQRTEKAFPGPEDLGKDTLDTVEPEDWNNMDQALQLHQLLKDLFQWSMDNKRFDLPSHWAELGASCQKICLKEIDFKDLMVITKGWKPTRQFRLLEARAQRIRENQATSQAIEE